AEAGDRLADEVIAEARRYGGIVLADVANAYDPAIITVGGTLILEHPELLEGVREEMRGHLNVAPPEVLLTPLGEDAVLCGALALAHAGSGLEPHMDSR
ncbi:MAG: ROK family protein, partial [Candidatus Bipolaricaulia bacterium]